MSPRFLTTSAVLALVMLWTPIGMIALQKDDNSSPDAWGGLHVIMQMTAQGATLEFDCAHGEFSVAGTYSPEHGGPIRRDETSRELPATYKGSIDGDTMQLQIELSDKTLQPPPLTLKRGARGRVFKCR